MVAYMFIAFSLYYLYKGQKQKCIIHTIFAIISIFIGAN